MGEPDFVARDQSQVQLFKTIDNGDFKKALQLVDKKLAKSPDPYLMAIKCFIQAKHPSVTERNNAVHRLMHLGEADVNDLINDEEALSVYDAAWQLVQSKQGFSKTRISHHISKGLANFRVKCCKEKTATERFAKFCFQSAIQRWSWLEAQQIAGALKTKYPQSHQYVMWEIACMELSHTVGREEVDSRMASFPAKMMAQLAKVTSTAPDVKKLPVRSIQTVQELLFYHKLIQNNVDERLAAYHDDKIGSSSEIAKGDWVFIRDEILLLRDAKKWRELAELCLKLLGEAHAADLRPRSKPKSPRNGDWLVWQSFWEAYANTHDTELFLKGKEMVRKHLSPDGALDNTYLRNARLAKLVADSSVTNEESDMTMVAPDEPTPIVDQMSRKVYNFLRYLGFYGDKAVGLMDVSGLIQTLSIGERLVFWCCLKPVLITQNYYFIDFEGHQIPPYSHSKPDDKYGEMVRSANYHILYNLCISECVMNPDGTCVPCGQGRWTWCPHCLQVGAADAISQYAFYMQSPTYKLDLPKTDSHPADNLTLIAAIDLLKLTAPVKSGLMPAKSKTYGYNASMSRILQAACLLEHAHSKSGANPQIKLVLILIYRLLGTGSLAMEMYKKLNLKGVQNDTLSYVLFDRISKFHPHETKIKIGGKVEVLSPLKDIRAADYFFQTADPQTLNNIIRSFSEGSYDTILGLVAVRQALENSMASVLISTEQRELMRLAGQKDELVMSDRLSQSSTYSGNPITREWVSNFDYKSAFPNFEIDQSATLPQKHDFLRCGPPPNKFRTLLSLATDKLFWFFSWAPTTISFNIEGILRSEITQHASHFYQYYSDILSPKTSDELDELLTHGEHVLVAAVLFAHAVLCPHTVDAQQQSAADSHWARFGVGSQLYQNLEMAFAELTANLTGEKCETQNVPKFEVLEPLYAAHQAAGLVIQLSQFVNGPQKPKAIGSTTATTVHSFAKAAVDIQRLVEKVSRDLKKRVNSPELEGNALGWLKGGFEGTEAASKVDAALLEVVGQKEMAQFAKEVTGSWRDAVLGLDLLKVDENIGKL